MAHKFCLAELSKESYPFAKRLLYRGATISMQNNSPSEAIELDEMVLIFILCIQIKRGELMI